MKISQIRSSRVSCNTDNKPSFNGKFMLPKKEIIVLGAPGCGKGTQTSRLSAQLGLPHIDTGSLLRAEVANNTPEGRIVKGYSEKGLLAPFELVAKIIQKKLASAECEKGYILDGFPRNLEQAKVLDKINKEVDAGLESNFKAIFFDINPKILLDRIVNRQSCPKCGEIYNKKFKPSKIADECDTCHVPLKTRADDNTEVAQARFKTYFEQTEPVIDYYNNKKLLHKLDARGTISEVWDRLMEIVNK